MWIFMSQRGIQKVVKEDYVSTYVRTMMPEIKTQEIGGFLRRVRNSVDGFSTLQGRIYWIEDPITGRPITGTGKLDLLGLV